MTLPDLLTDLTDLEKPVTYSGLLQLSDLPVEGLTELKTVWSNLPTERRRETVRKLIELADDNVEFDFSSIFKSCLTDGDDAIREMAAKGLWEAEDRALIRPLVKLLENDTCAEVRASAAMSLKNFAVMSQNGKLLSRDGDRIRRALLAVVNSPTEDIDVRRRAIEAVASFNTSETNSAVREAYESDNPTLVQSAIFGMGQSSNADMAADGRRRDDESRGSGAVRGGDRVRSPRRRGVVPHLCAAPPRRRLRGSSCLYQGARYDRRADGKAHAAAAPHRRR